MKLTNKYNIPKPIELAISNSSYNLGDKPSDISCTRLIDSPCIRILSKLYDPDIEEDVSDMIWALIGTSIHYIIERAGAYTENYEKEKRVYMYCQGWTISGQFDLYDKTDKILYDFKIASVWEAINGVKQSRINQLNVLASLMQANGYEIKGISVIYIFRDWIKVKAGKDNYPEKQVMVLPLDLLSREERWEYIKERVRLHQNAQKDLDNYLINGADDKLLHTTPCSQEERWQDDLKFAIMKKGRKSALRLVDTMEQAEIFIKNAGYNDTYIEERKSVPRRCLEYCPVAKYCKWFAK